MTKQQLMNIILKRGTENIIPGEKELKKLLSSNKKLNVYLGIDPTATHIHLGHAVPLRKLQAFADLGHNVYFLIGDFTALVGDTSDKNNERPMLTEAEIEENFQTYKKQASRILDFNKVKVVHNNDWLSRLNFSDLLSLTKYFSVNDFTSRELIRKRLKSGKRVGLPEMLYPIMQGYDSYHLNTDVQLGGTDQTFNMQAGRSLIKTLREKESFVLANGFLLGTDGRKMSKSWGNAIWLDDSPKDMYGKIMSVKDLLIEDYFILATSMPIDKIKKTIEETENPLVLKKILANQILTELYDKESAQKAATHFKKTIQKKMAPQDVKTVVISAKSLSVSELIDLLVKAGIIKSKSQGRRLHKQNALYLEKESLIEEKIELKKENIFRIGKRRYFKVIVQ